jgi:hemoglobin-like flavoprotein
MEIDESVQQILGGKDKLGVMFYEYFLTNYPEVQRHFENVDLKRQSNLLVTALMIIGRHAAHPSPATELYLKYLGTKHNDLRVSKDVYSVWVKAMLETMQKFHGQAWTPRLEDQWRQAFGRAIELMFQGYDQRVTV